MLPSLKCAGTLPQNHLLNVFFRIFGMYASKDRNSIFHRRRVEIYSGGANDKILLEDHYILLKYFRKFWGKGGCNYEWVAYSPQSPL